MSDFRQYNIEKQSQRLAINTLYDIRTALNTQLFSRAGCVVLLFARTCRFFFCEVLENFHKRAFITHINAS